MSVRMLEPHHHGLSPPRLFTLLTGCNSFCHNASYVHTGLSYGFRIGFDRHCVTLHSPVRNHPSALENRDQMRGYIEAERNAG